MDFTEANDNEMNTINQAYQIALQMDEEVYGTLGYSRWTGIFVDEE